MSTGLELSCGQFVGYIHRHRQLQMLFADVSVSEILMHIVDYRCYDHAATYLLRHSLILDHI